MRFDIDEIKARINEKEIKFSYPYELVDEWKQYISDENKGLTTGFDVFDRDLRNTLRGKVGAYIGYGGTKKSLLALMSMHKSVKMHKAKGIYSTMEMPAVQILERMIDMAFDAETDNASWRFEQLYKQKKEVIKELQTGLKDFYGTDFAITSKSRCTPDDYRKMIEKYKEEHGNLDVLVVDGLSMMGGDGSETESYTTNSGHLKDLANEYNVFIALICHLSKGADLHTRDTRRFVRGSEKILDNVDFIVMLSLVIDPLRTVGRTFEYRKDIGYARMYNKRGSGNTINLIYEFDQLKLLMRETTMEPSDYELDSKDKAVF